MSWRYEKQKCKGVGDYEENNKTIDSVYYGSYDGGFRDAGNECKGR